MQTGLFDWQFRFEKLEKNGDPLRHDPQLTYFVDLNMNRQLLVERC